MSPFVILGVSGLFCHFYITFDGNPVSYQCKPRSDVRCGILSGSAVFAYDPFTGFQVRKG